MCIRAQVTLAIFAHQSENTMKSFNYFVFIISTLDFLFKTFVFHKVKLYVVPWGDAQLGRKGKGPFT